MTAFTNYNPSAGSSENTVEITTYNSKKEPAKKKQANDEYRQIYNDFDEAH